MKNRKRLFIIAGTLSLIIFLVVLGVGHRWSSKHVYYITGGQPHPVDCIPCHVNTQRSGFAGRFLKKHYLSPLNIAVSPDGRQLYVIAQEGNALLVVATAERKVISKIGVGERPHSVVLSRNGEIGYVSNQWSNTVSVIHLSDQRIIDTLNVGSGPSGLSLGPKGIFLYVANSYSNDISILNLESGHEIKRLAAGRNPCSVQFSPDGKTVYVTNLLSNPAPFRTSPVSEVTVIDAISQQVVQRKNLSSAHLLENVVFTPTGDLAFVTLARPKNLIPATQIERGWMMTYGVGVIEQNKEGKVAQFLLDEPNTSFADPYDIVITPDGKLAFVTQAGADYVTVFDVEAVRTLFSEATPANLATYANDLDLSSRYVIKRIPTGPNPKGLAVSTDGKRLYVAERLADRIAVIDTEIMEIVDTIDLGGPGEESMVRRGRRLFNSAENTFQGQFSCSTCHPDGHEDGLTYDLTGTGRNLANVQTLRDLSGTSPFKWNGKNVSIYMQCGMRFSKFLTRTESYSSEDLDALVAFIKRDLSHPPNRYRNASGELTPAQLRGKAIFERTQTNDGRSIPSKDRCNTCHPPPYFTNRQKSDVGTLAATDSPVVFDSPKLSNIYESAPYLHDGRAATLEEIWTKFNPEDKHGIANDLTKLQLNDMVEYLISLEAEPSWKEE